MKRVPLALPIILMIAATAAAQSVPATDVQETPGVFARIPIPRGWQFRYDPGTDSIVLLEPDRNQVVLFVGASGDASRALREFLAGIGGDVYAGQIEATDFGALHGAQVLIDAGGGSKDWILSLEKEGLLLGVWIKTTGSFEAIRPLIDRIVLGTEFAPARWPQDAAGRYQTSRMSSTDISGGLYADDYLTLHPGGAAQESGSIAGSSGGSSALGQYSGGGARWEIRGDRLLLSDAERFFNYRINGIYGNGISLLDEQGNKLLWVRQ